MAGFEYRGQISGGKENPVMHSVLIGNTQTVKVGDAVKLVAFSSGGGLCRATAGEEVLGILVGIVDKNGIDLDNTSTDNYDGTWTSSSKTYVTSADNMTDKLVRGQVVVDKEAKWYNDSAGTLAAADEYKFFDVTDQDQIADQDGADNAGAFVLLERDPDGDADASKGIFKLAESELDPYAQQ